MENERGREEELKLGFVLVHHCICQLFGRLGPGGSDIVKERENKTPKIRLKSSYFKNI